MRGITWRRSSETESSVSVNARLARLSSNDLLDLAESSIITAGRELLHARGTGRELSLTEYYLDRSALAAKTAAEALEIVRSRS